MPINREALEERVRIEVQTLGPDHLSWWTEHRVDPFVVARDGFSHYVVARTDGPPLLFFDRQDSFGRYSEKRWEDGLQLYEDLGDAVRHLIAKERMSRMLSETASSVLRLGFLEPGYFDIRWRSLGVLAALGPDAAVAVPRLIEIMGTDELTGELQERAIATLAAVGPKAAPAVPKLIEMAGHDTANARGWCLMAFESIGPAAAPAVPLLIDLLLGRVSVDPDPFYVTMAANALGAIGAIEALPALLQVLRETDDPDVARDVVEAIGKLGPDAAGAGPSLVEMAADNPMSIRFHESADVREAVREALRRIGKPMATDPPMP